jgi:hypothetical protein
MDSPVKLVRLTDDEIRTLLSVLDITDKDALTIWDLACTEAMRRLRKQLTDALKASEE